MGRAAIVVGGGIGGLATAVALIGRGWDVEVLERATSPENPASPGEPAASRDRVSTVPAHGAGSGLSLWPNGLRALGALGLAERVGESALRGAQAGIRAPSGRWLSRAELGELERRFGPMMVIHRARLLDILRQALPSGVTRTGVEVDAVRMEGAEVVAAYGGATSRAGLLVGSDGIHSAVRRSAWPDAHGPRYAGYTAWRLIVDPREPLSSGSETWGRGERVGLAPLSGGGVYMFGVANAPEGARSADGELAEMRRRFANWHAPIPALLAATREDAILRNDIYDLPPLRSYVTGRIALLGDAAHAMTPDRGQGANQALEDAVTLAALLDEHPEVETALAAYDRVRRPRTQAIARSSRRTGVVAQWSAVPAVALRDGLLRMTPASSMLRVLAPVLSWEPPA